MVIIINRDGIVIRDTLETDIEKIVELLNNYLSFGLSNEEKILNFLNSKKYICKTLLLNNKIIGFRKATILNNLDFLELNNLGYSNNAIEFLKSKEITKCISLDLTVIEPTYRGHGFYNDLELSVKLSVDEDLPLIGIKWAYNDFIKEVTLRKSKDNLLIENYWLEDEVYCDICRDFCSCPAIIFIK